MRSSPPVPDEQVRWRRFGQRDARPRRAPLHRSRRRRRPAATSSANRTRCRGDPATRRQLAAMHGATGGCCRRSALPQHALQQRGVRSASVADETHQARRASGVHRLPRSSAPRNSFISPPTSARPVQFSLENANRVSATTQWSSAELHAGAHRARPARWPIRRGRQRCCQRPLPSADDGDVAVDAHCGQPAARANQTNRQWGVQAAAASPAVRDCQRGWR